MNKKEIASNLSFIATLLELNHENSFKIKAFSSASRILQTSELESEEIIAQIKAKKIKGIGPQISECIISLYETGGAKALTNIKSQFKSEFLELLELPGLGAKKLKALRDKLGVESIEALEKACTSGEIDNISGFGKKTQSNFLNAIKQHREYKKLTRFDIATISANAVLRELKEKKEILKAEVTGELRRKLEIISSAELIISMEDTKNALSLFESLTLVSSVEKINKDEFLLSIIDNSQLTIHVYKDELFEEKLFLTTGSTKHLEKLLKQKTHDKAFKSEIEHYKSLNLPFIPPELREDIHEIDLSLNSPLNLIESGEIQGVIHAHSTYSDGADSLKNMAIAARDKGYHYLGITDHSQTASYAGGLTEDEVKKQHDEIDSLNESLAPFKIFKGIESDILIDGSLDYKDSILETFDFLIASIHSGFSKDKKKMTKRIVKAIENPFCSILGHMTGRLLLIREGYGLEIDEILEAAAKNNVAIELNCSPKRLDMDWRFHAKAKKLGVKIPICPDAHSVDAIDYIKKYGIGIARKGRLSKEDIPNALGLNEFSSYIKT